MNEANQIPETLRKFAVTTCQLPALAHFMHDYLPNETYVPRFLGQCLDTTYFDTKDFALRRSRLKAGKGDPYVVMRLRRYPNGMCMLQIKTQDEKFRLQIGSTTADILTDEPFTVVPLPAVTTLSSLVDIPPSVLAELLKLIDDAPLLPVTEVCYHRYAIENAAQRMTLDVATMWSKTLALLDRRGELALQPVRGTAGPAAARRRESMAAEPCSA